MKFTLLFLVCLAAVCHAQDYSENGELEPDEVGASTSTTTLAPIASTNKTSDGSCDPIWTALTAQCMKLMLEVLQLSNGEQVDNLNAKQRVDLCCANEKFDFCTLHVQTAAKIAKATIPLCPVEYYDTQLKALSPVMLVPVRRQCVNFRGIECIQSGITSIVDKVKGVFGKRK